MLRVVIFNNLRVELCMAKKTFIMSVKTIKSVFDNQMFMRFDSKFVADGYCKNQCYDQF